MNGEDINFSSILHAVVQDRNLLFLAYRLQMAKYRKTKNPPVEEDRAASKSPH
jgi:hypothetical protein